MHVHTNTVCSHSEPVCGCSHNFSTHNPCTLTTMDDSNWIARGIKLTTPNLTLPEKDLIVYLEFPFVLDSHALVSSLCRKFGIGQADGCSSTETDPCSHHTRVAFERGNLRWELGAGSHSISLGPDGNWHFTVPIKIDLAAGSGNASCGAHVAPRPQASLDRTKSGQWARFSLNPRVDQRWEICEKAEKLVEEERVKRAKTEYKEVIIFDKIHRFPGDMKRTDLFKAVRQLLGDGIDPSWSIRIYDPNTDKDVHLGIPSEETSSKNMLYTVEVPVPWHVKFYINECDKNQLSDLPSSCSAKAHSNIREEESQNGSNVDDMICLPAAQGEAAITGISHIHRNDKQDLTSQASSSSVILKKANMHKRLVNKKIPKKLEEENDKS